MRATDVGIAARVEQGKAVETVGVAAVHTGEELRGLPQGRSLAVEVGTQHHSGWLLRPGPIFMQNLVVCLAEYDLELGFR
jgi:hypothetical protein